MVERGLWETAQGYLASLADGARKFFTGGGTEVGARVDKVASSFGPSQVAQVGTQAYVPPKTEREQKKKPEVAQR